MISSETKNIKIARNYLNLDLENNNVHWNLTVAELYEKAIVNNEALLTANMALSVQTGKYTGRSPQDKFIVKEPESDKVDWGKVNKPISPEVFDKLYDKVSGYLSDKDVFVMDLFCGADPEYRLPIRVASEAAYHALFAHNMFIRPTDEQLKTHIPGFTVLAAPKFEADPSISGTESETFILVSFSKKIILIGGTLYSGEVKKGIFGVMNYLLPEKGVMPMHCSANEDLNGKSAVFFGLSGTGKTTLSADEGKTLIGDDEHGWSDHGIFNFEGGCYAKTYNLSEKDEPLIYATTKMPGTILENVVLDKKRHPQFENKSLTENTRCSYPLDMIPNASKTGMAGHPSSVIFLTADAFGVLPPISRLTPEQAMYHFLSGYTAKVAGTERGVTEPIATFSACFGSPFMPRHPHVYAEMLAEKINKHSSTAWLLNTGWTGGPYGVGSRIKLQYTRRMLDAAITGELDHAEYRTGSVFKLNMPLSIEGVPSEILVPRDAWPERSAFDKKAKLLAQMFKDNFKKFESTVNKETLEASPL
ncbi:MAG: phosphoenolpyruvate carboxykinase (ATP) [Balneolales bacterium]